MPLLKDKVFYNNLLQIQELIIIYKFYKMLILKLIQNLISILQKKLLMTVLKLTIQIIN